MMKLKVNISSLGPSRVSSIYLSNSLWLRATFFLALFFSFPLLSIAQPVRGQPGDLWADVVLGKSDNGIPNSAFGQIQINEATALSAFNMGGQTVDATNGICYVWDSGNNRILGFNINGLTPFQNTAENQPGLTPTILLGQPDFFHTGCNHDSNWQNYPTPPSASASCLCSDDYFQFSIAESGTGVNMAVDPQGNLYVPDYFNNRPLR
jgi:hypothetical protein